MGLALVCGCKYFSGTRNLLLLFSTGLKIYQGVVRNTAVAEGCLIGPRKAGVDNNKEHYGSFPMTARC